MCISLTSCPDDPINEIVSDNENLIEGNNSDAFMTAKTILKHVKVTYNYSNYYFHIKINSSLSNVLANKDIRYGLECGYDSYDYEKYLTGSETLILADVCVFIDNSEYYLEALYGNSYMALINESNLNTDERQFLKELKELLDKKEPAAKASYAGRVFVEVDGKRYYVKNYND